MRGVLLSLLFALCWLNPAIALTPAQQSVLSGTNPCAGVTLSVDFARGVFCKANIRYPSFLAIPGAGFTRASTGYAQWSNGTLQLFASGVPRITDQGLLVEQASTNLVLQSQAIGNGVQWTVNAPAVATLNTPATLAPDGTSTATSIDPTGTGSTSENITVTANTTYTYSLYVKLGTLAAANYKLAFFDVTNSAFIAQDIVPTQTPTTTGWVRVVLSVTTPATCTTLRVYGIRNSGSVSGTVYLWGAQLEALGYSTSYIPTTSVSASRAVDVANVTTNVLGSGNFTIVTKAQGISPNQTGFFPGLLGINDGFVNNELLEYATNGGPSVNGKLVTSAVQQWDVPLSVTAVSGGAVKLAITNNGGTARGAASGQAPVSLGAWSAFTPTQVMLGADGAASNQLNGYINFFSAIPKGVSDIQLQALTR